MIKNIISFVSYNLEYFLSCSVTRLRLTLCDPMDSACQASLSLSMSQSFLKLMSIESVMLSSHLVLCLASQSQINPPSRDLCGPSSSQDPLYPGISQGTQTLVSRYLSTCETEKPHAGCSCSYLAAQGRINAQPKQGFTSHFPELLNIYFYL